MKDLPMFTTEFGVASLTLSNIPYTKAAYVQIQDSCEPVQLVKDCLDFSIAVGAESVYATGDKCLKSYPLHTSVLELECVKNNLPPTHAVLQELSEEDMERWRQIYLTRMKNVHNAAYISAADMKRYFEQNKCFFVILDSQEIGIGMVDDNEIRAVAGIVPKMGKDLVSALATQISGDPIKVTVSEQNKPAMHLYERLGFRCARIIANWYKIY